MPLLYCRFCAKQTSFHNLRNFQIDNDLRISLLEKISFINEYFINFNDSKLPETICEECFEALEASYKFFVNVRQSQEMLAEVCRMETDRDFKIKLEDVDCDIPNSGNSWAAYEWSCGHCSLTLPSMNAVREHSKTEHRTCSAFKCADCDHRSDSTFEDFVAHVRTHRDSLKYACEYCNIKVEDNTHSETHKQKDHCLTCGETFDSTSLLTEHQTQYMSNITALLTYGAEICCTVKYEDIKTWAEYPCICMHCKERFADKKALVKHSVNTHNLCFALLCIDCNETQSSFMEFVEHVHKHRPKLMPICPFCNIDMGGFYNLEHVESHKPNAHICVICGHAFKQRRYLRRHEIKLKPNPYTKPLMKRDKGPKAPVTVKDLTCPDCGKLCKSKLALKGHRISHTNRAKDFICDMCGRGFYSRSNLNCHKKIHDSSCVTTCKICNKDFKNTHLREHVKLHTMEKTIQCDHCKKFFKTKKAVKDHIKTHMSLKPFQCTYCYKSFIYENGLKVHLNQHTGARPYKCDTCDRDFTNWSNCDKHMRRKHGTTLAKSVVTPQGKVALNHEGKPEILLTTEVEEWSHKVLNGGRKFKNPRPPIVLTGITPSSNMFDSFNNCM